MDLLSPHDDSDLRSSGLRQAQSCSRGHEQFHLRLPDESSKRLRNPAA
jgi:hypothetical protein